MGQGEKGEKNVVPEQAPLSPSSSKSADGFLLIGALLIIGGHLLFGLIIGEFTYSAVYVTMAIWLVVISLASGDWGLSGPRAKKVLGYSLGIISVILLANDLRFGFPDGLVDNIANLVFYAGGVLAFLGARGLKS